MPSDLQGVLETRHISARTETYIVNLSKDEAEAARDALVNQQNEKYNHKHRFREFWRIAADNCGCQCVLMSFVSFAPFCCGRVKSFTISYSRGFAVVLIRQQSLLMNQILLLILECLIYLGLNHLG